MTKAAVKHKNNLLLKIDEQYLKLSDAFAEAPELLENSKIDLELAVRVLNINEGRNIQILQKCTELDGYARLIAKIRAYLDKGLSLTEALTQAVKDCIEEGILAEFLREHATEAINMLTQEFNIDIAKRVWWKEGREEGLERH